MSSGRILVFAGEAFDDLRYWVEVDPRRANRILKLLEEARRTPFSGTGKPELLRHLGGNVWSRRIDREHRLVHAVDRDAIRVLQCRYHYVRR